MKFLVVIISVLVLGAYGAVIQDDDAIRVISVPLQPDDSDESVLYLVGEPGDAESDEAASAVDLQRSFDFGNSAQLDAAVQRVLSDGVYIPIVTQACTNSVSGFVCGMLGFKNGVCAATNIVHCSNE